ncbi:hypothetical protein RCL1_008122 [Eukaryota sp. TZLM3-RCL]
MTFMASSPRAPELNRPLLAYGRSQRRKDQLWSLNHQYYILTSGPAETYSKVSTENLRQLTKKIQWIAEDIHWNTWLSWINAKKADAEIVPLPLFEYFTRVSPSDNLSDEKLKDLAAAQIRFGGVVQRI